MRIAATGLTMLFALASCSTTEPAQQSPFQQPNALMRGEIARRVEQIPYQHREELLQNLMWIAQTGEQTIPALLDGLRHESPKVRSSCAWVLGRLHDRRTIPSLQQAMKDEEASVRMECARSLVLMGDLAWSPTLIEGLDSDRKEVRYLCHEALKTATGNDFGYDHLDQDQRQLQVAVLRWRQWWGDYSGDQFFAQNYQQANGLDAQLAAPAGETQPNAAVPTAPQPQPGAGEQDRAHGRDDPNPVPPAVPLQPIEVPSGDGANQNSPEKAGAAMPVVELPVVEIQASDIQRGQASNKNGGDGPR